jgi:hypothetical protein
VKAIKPVKIIAGLAIAGGLAAGAVGVSAGVANADPGWGPPPPPPGDWHGDHDGWGGDPGPADWAPPPPPPDWSPPGAWNGGWEPDGGLCIFDLCLGNQ